MHEPVHVYYNTKVFFDDLLLSVFFFFKVRRVVVPSSNRHALVLLLAELLRAQRFHRRETTAALWQLTTLRRRRTVESEASGFCKPNNCSPQWISIAVVSASINQPRHVYARTHCAVVLSDGGSTARATNRGAVGREVLNGAHCGRGVRQCARRPPCVVCK